MSVSTHGSVSCTANMALRVHSLGGYTLALIISMFCDLSEYCLLLLVSHEHMI